MTTLAERKPLNRREFSYYLLFGVVVLFLFTIASLTVLYALPRNAEGPVRVLIGASAGFPSMERPYAVSVEDVSLFIVRTESGWLALDRRTPSILRRCLFAWTEVNGRFEDPCYGSKFAIDGSFIWGPAGRDLDQYPITEKSGELFVDLTIIPGEHADPIQ